jgi:urea transport system permease protein
MGLPIRLYYSVLITAITVLASSGVLQADENSEARVALADALVSPREEQPEKVAALEVYSDPVIGEILNLWQRASVYVFQMPDGTAVPITLDRKSTEKGNAYPAIRVDTGEELVVDGMPVLLKEGELDPAATNAKLRRSMKAILDTQALIDPNPEARKNAILKFGMQQKQKNLPLLEQRLEKEHDGSVKEALREAIALINLTSSDEKIQVEALNQLGRMRSVASKSLIEKITASDTAPAEVRKAASSALVKIEQHLFWVDFNGTIFRGVSLGSVLLVVALGLAITFGLMGIINMAHGEIMVVGGYATYLVQCVFGRGASLAPFGISFSIPGMNLNESTFGYQTYFIFALPVAFFCAAGVGLLLERSVIQFLYRRPLESLLATWGVSLVMQQLFRLVFGPANVPVYSPNWLLGSFTVNGVIMNYNRVFVIGFAIIIVIGTALLLSKTPLGLLIRSVMQNRNMASCMGVRTERVNMLTFAFGSGLAGLAGAFLSQIGNIGPSTGQTYIVDSFMVVVLGGVGNLIGTVISALGIGTTDQILQTLLRNPVIGKVLVLVGIILFLQWRPQGLFVTRSRGLES